MFFNKVTNLILLIPKFRSVFVHVLCIVQPIRRGVVRRRAGRAGELGGREPGKQSCVLGALLPIKAHQAN